MKSIAKHPKKENLNFNIDFLINFTHSGVLGKTLLSSIPAKCSQLVSVFVPNGVIPRCNYG